MDQSLSDDQRRARKVRRFTIAVSLTMIILCNAIVLVLLPQYRGQGIGHAFFDYREAHAKAHGYGISAFCGVIRPADHPLRPASYQPLDPFWHKRGYRKADGLMAHFSWKDIGEADQAEKPMQFWLKDL